MCRLIIASTVVGKDMKRNRLLENFHSAAITAASGAACAALGTVACSFA